MKHNESSLWTNSVHNVLEPLGDSSQNSPPDYPKLFKNPYHGKSHNTHNWAQYTNEIICEEDDEIENDENNDERRGDSVDHHAHEDGERCCSYKG